MDWLGLLKKGGKGGGWVAIAAGVLMFISKQLGLPVTEEFWMTILGLIGGGTASVVGAKFVPDGLPVMPTNERACWDAWWLLDQVLSDDPQARAHLDGLHDSMANYYRVERPVKKGKPSNFKNEIAEAVKVALMTPQPPKTEVKP